MCTRIELRDTVRRLGKSPQVSDMQSVEREREALASHLVTLTHLRNAAEVADHDITPSRITRDNEAEFDNSDDLDPSDEDSPAPSGPSHPSPDITNAIPVEEQQIYLPYNGALADVEINLRKNQASRLLHQLRELIAHKSFQYSHIIRAAPRKGVRTKSRAVVKELVNKITLHARMYNHCRSRLVALGCDAVTSSVFQRLTKGDLNASTAVLQPNEPGSTTLRLSWLWHNARTLTGVMAEGNGADAAAAAVSRDGPDAAAAAAADAAQFWECKFFHACLFSLH